MSTPLGRGPSVDGWRGDVVGEYPSQLGNGASGALSYSRRYRGESIRGRISHRS